MPTFDVEGRSIELPDDRKVWVTRTERSWFIKFYKKGKVQGIVISYEAAEALRALLDPAVIPVVVLPTGPD